MASGKTSAVGILRSEVAALTAQFTETSRRLEGLVLKANADGTIASRRLDALMGKKSCLVRFSASFNPIA